MPRLAARAANGVSFSNFYVASSVTQPTHASMFTGLHSFEHGAHSYEIDIAPWKGDAPAEQKIDNVVPLSDAFTTLAECLRDDGYDTAGIVANSVGGLFESDNPALNSNDDPSVISGTNVGAYVEVLYKHDRVPLMARVRAMFGDFNGVLLSFGFAF